MENRRHADGGDGVPEDGFAFGSIEPDYDRRGPYLEMAIKRVPLMQAEILRGRPDFVRGDYRVLAEAEKAEFASKLLSACVVRYPLCEADWNAGLTSRQTRLVWQEMVREN